MFEIPVVIPRVSRRPAGLVLLALALPLAPLPAEDPTFDAKGFDRRRELVSELPFEHIDPMTGNLLLTFTDLVLPGNGGFDLRVQRTYNAKIYDEFFGGGSFVLGEDSWAGIGWRLHFGRVLNANSVAPGPTIEMPDGSRHGSFPHLDGNAQHFMTRDFWTYDKSPPAPVLRLPNGVRYTFGHGSGDTRYATGIEDPFGNRIEIVYAPSPAPLDVIDRVVQHLAGGRTRQVEFTHDATLPGPGGRQATGSLRSMSFGGRTWTYRQKTSSDLGYTLLTAVEPPEIPAWRFQYREGPTTMRYLLTRLTTPNGGTVGYTYQPQAFFLGSGVISSPAVVRRSVSGRDVPPGTWSYTYSSSTARNRTVVTAPCGPVTAYTFRGIGPQEGEAWELGSLESKEIRGAGGAVLEREDYVWRRSQPISDVPESGSSFDTHAALLGSRTVSRGGRSYRTTYTYDTSPYRPSRAGNFNDFGRAHTIDEEGELRRRTRRTFFYGSSSDPSFGTYIVDRVATETVEVGGEPFTRSFTWNPVTGFRTSETIYGIRTTFAATSRGDVRSLTDANGHTTRFSYEWGVEKDMSTPVFTIRRTIHRDGTVASEGRRGFTTRFEYDRLGRPTRTLPPVGDPRETVYDPQGTFLQVQRGPGGFGGRRFTRTDIDGFGRPVATVDSVGVRTEIEYDACGRRIFESFPFTGARIGATTRYDALGRVVENRYPDSSRVSFAYGPGVEVEITDPEGRRTRQRWQAFGDPQDARLMALIDAHGQRTAYAYNTLGSLTSVDPPGPHGSRTWIYNPRNQLAEERHPENGRTLYSYDPVGNLIFRRDEQFGLSAFGYDGNNRLVAVDRPGSAYDTFFQYDASDNRTRVRNAYVDSTFTYDGADRLTRRRDRVLGQSFTTAFEYDGRDNLRALTYPSGGRALYRYDTEDRLLSVTDGKGFPYALAFTYHPSGGVASYRTGNGLNHTFSYDRRYRLQALNSGGVLALAYRYDRVGNVTAIDDSRPGMDQSFAYDALDRLTTANGPWGGGSFGYDALGNRTFKSLGGLRTDYRYGASSQRLTGASGGEPDTLSYDLNGNLARDLSGSFRYTPTNRLEEALVGGAATLYRYDGDDLRKVKIGEGETSYYVHGPGGSLLAEYEGGFGGTAFPTREYIYAGPRLLAEVRPSVLVTDPPSLTLAVVQGQPSPPPRPLQISVTGTPPACGNTFPPPDRPLVPPAGNISDGSPEPLPAAAAPPPFPIPPPPGPCWLATPSDPWLTISPRVGRRFPETAQISVDPSGLTLGRHEGSVTVLGRELAPRVVPVTVFVLETAELFVTPGRLDFVAPANGFDPPPQVLDVLFPGNAVSWQATASEPWIGLAPAAGDTPGRIRVGIDSQGLEDGRYSAEITVSSPGTPGSPKTVTVHLTVPPRAGQPCHPEAVYCEPFDGLAPGSLEGQGGWAFTTDDPGLVVADPRGTANAFLLDPGPGGRVNGSVAIPEIPVDGSEIRLHVMTHGTDPAVDHKNLGKIEFFTLPGAAWGKTFRTFGALRFGTSLHLQYGPNINRRLITLEPGRWYGVRVTFVGGRVQAYVDRQLVFEVGNPLEAGLPFQELAVTGWDVEPGAAYLDQIEVFAPDLLVDPLRLTFEGSSGGGGGGGGEFLGARARGAGLGRGCDDDGGEGGEGAVSEGSGPPAAAAPRRWPPALDGSVAFEENLGQADGSVAFLARGLGHAVLARRHDLLLALPGPAPGEAPPGGSDSRRPRSLETAFLKMKLGGAEPFRWEAGERLPGWSHYFVGADPGRWRSFVPRYADLVAREVYPGVDLVLRGNRGRIEYDLVVSPGADPAAIEILFDGARKVEVDEGGDLVIEAASGRRVRQPRPLLFQEEAGEVRPVAGAYRLGSDGAVRFQVGAYDRRRPLVIDPIVVWSRALGGSAQDAIEAIAVDAQGFIYATGSTSSVDFPLVDPLQPTIFCCDAFVSKFTPDGQSLVYSTYLGGREIDGGSAIRVDSAGRALVAGTTSSFPPNARTFPVVNATPIGPAGGRSDAVLAFLSADGSELLFSTILGGSAEDGATDAELSPGGATAYLVGTTASTDFPLANPGQSAPGGGFVTALSLTGAVLGDGELVYSTYLGEPGRITASALALDTTGRVVVAGGTSAPPAAAVGCLPQASATAFVTRLSAAGVPGAFRCLDGSSDDEATALALDGAGHVLVAGRTSSSDFPAVDALFGPGGREDAFVARLTPDLAELTFATAYGGESFDFASDLAAAPGGEIVVVGETRSAELPLHSPLLACRPLPANNSFLLRLDPQAPQVRYATYLPAQPLDDGSGSHRASSVGISGGGGILVAGQTGRIGAVQSDGFLAEVRDGSPAPVPSRLRLVADEDQQNRFAEGQVREGSESTFVFRVLRFDGLEAVSVDYSTADGSAIAGNDYQAATGTLTFGEAGVCQLQASVTVFDDGLGEGDEDFVVRLENLAGDGVIEGPASLPVNICDDEGGGGGDPDVLTATFTVRHRRQATGPDWQALEEIPWLELSAAAGTGPSTVTVTVSTEGLEGGTYDGTIRITAEGVRGSPQVIDVTLVVDGGGAGGDTVLHLLEVDRHTTAQITDLRADEVFEDSTIVAQTELGGDDVACDVELGRSGGVSQFTTGNGTVANQADFAQLLALPGFVKVVNEILWCGGISPGWLGCAPIPGESFIVVRIDEDDEGILWLHEFGHTRGLEHREVEGAVMHPIISPGNEGLDEEECEALRD